MICWINQLEEPIMTHEIKVPYKIKYKIIQLV